VWLLVSLRSVLQLVVTANVVLSSPILSTLIMKAISSSETSFLIRPTQRHIPEDGTLQLKTYFRPEFHIMKGLVVLKNLAYYTPQIILKFKNRPCRGSGDQSPASHRGGPGFEPCSSHVGSVVDRATLRQVSSEYFGFPCHSFIPLTASQSSQSIIQDWYSRPINGCSNSGLGSTPAHS
jgi:hypothetical protein